MIFLHSNDGLVDYEFMMTHSLECQQGVGVKFILKIRADKFGINFHYICIESNENFVHNYELGYTSLINNLFPKKSQHQNI